MSKPIYQQLAKELAREIKAGVYKAETLPLSGAGKTV